MLLFFFFPLQVVSPILTHCQHDGGVELHTELGPGLLADSMQRDCSASVTY